MRIPRRAARQECGNLTQPVRTYGWENTVRIFVADLGFAKESLGSIWIGIDGLCWYTLRFHYVVGIEDWPIVPT
jgi:hypothetical protein